MNFKSLFLSAALAFSAFSLIACSDSSSGSDDDESSSSAAEIILSSASETSPLLNSSKINAKVLSDGNGGFTLGLSGSLQIDNDFIPEGEDEEAEIFFNFDSLSFIVGKKESGKIYEVGNLPVKHNITFPIDNISVATGINQISLKEDDIGCGPFVLYVWIYMSNEEGNGYTAGQFKYSALIPVNFELQCKVIESSTSQEETCTEVKMNNGRLANLLGSDVFTMGFDAGTTDQITLVVEGKAAYFKAGAGVEIWEEANQTAGVLPDDPVCLESFATAFNSKNNNMELAPVSWYIVKTPNGTYPIMIGNIMFNGDTEAEVNFTYYTK